MWSDDETTDDLFGFRVHADLIRELIMDPTVLPAAIGVYGDWPSGLLTWLRRWNLLQIISTASCSHFGWIKGRGFNLHDHRSFSI
jgi:hypothetical protein